MATDELFPHAVKDERRPTALVGSYSALLGILNLLKDVSG